MSTTISHEHKQASPSPDGAPAPEQIPDDHLTGHEYDGISEFDNPTPGWWHMIFFATIMFSGVYALFWHASPLSWTVEEDWQANQLAYYQQVFAGVGELKPTEEDILRMMGDKKLLPIAESSFRATCSSCHAADGGGLVGPNLCDDLYKNIKTLPDLYNVITNGAGNGAMPAWRSNFSQNERVLLAAYVATLRGTKPSAPKPLTKVEEPLYRPIDPWPPIPASAAPTEPTTK